MQTYKQEIPSLFHYNELLIVSDGLQARIGSLTGNKEWFKVWREHHGQDGTRGTGFQPVKASAGFDGQDAQGTGEHGQDAHATVRIRQGAYLPHWTRKGGIYAVTFRLADSLPQHAIAGWKKEREEIIRRARQAGREITAAETKRLQVLFSDKVEKYLDAAYGACWMRRPEIAGLVENAREAFRRPALPAPRLVRHAQPRSRCSNADQRI